MCCVFKVIVWVRGLIKENTSRDNPELIMSILDGLYKHEYVDWYNTIVGVTQGREIRQNMPKYTYFKIL